MHPTSKRPGMVACDCLILGAGIAGIGLKYKLQGKTILIDKNPFQYKIGESQIPNLIHSDPGIFSLIPKLVKMKSFTRKLGTVFCDSYHGKYAASLPTSLGDAFAFHCEREEVERLLTKELAVDIRKETVVDIDLEKNLVVTNKATYRFSKFLLDCSGPAMVIANKLGLVSPVDQFQGMKAQWSYWTIDRLNDDVDSWAHWTVLNKIGPDSWIWQIPIHNSSILSMGLLHRGAPMSNDEFIEYVQRYSASCYQLTSIARNPEKAIKPYMKEVHSRSQYSKISRQCSGKNWILVGDAYCFADPVYSVGTGVAMLEAITIADNLNKNAGKFDHAWYEKKCSALIKTVVEGIGTWYSGGVFDKDVNKRINRTILRGGFFHYFKPSRATVRATKVQLDSVRIFPKPVLSSGPILRSGFRVYSFGKGAFSQRRNSLSIVCKGKPVRVTSRAVRDVFDKHVIGKKLSFFDLYRISQLHLFAHAEREYFWKVIRLLEVIGGREPKADRLYYFHPEKYEIVEGRLKLGERDCHLIFEGATAGFFERLKGQLLFGKDLARLAGKSPALPPGTRQDIKLFLETFQAKDTFGENFCLS